jgi:hypothetical protein
LDENTEIIGLGVHMALLVCQILQTAGIKPTLDPKDPNWQAAINVAAPMVDAWLVHAIGMELFGGYGFPVLSQPGGPQRPVAPVPPILAK